MTRRLLDFVARVLRSLGREDARRWLVLAAILLFIGIYKITYTRYTFSTNVDGGYYTDIAANVRDGLGLTTDVCILYKGCEYFPHPTGVYPLWPLLYGFVAKFFPLVETGKWLATSLYFTALVFGYLWATRLYRKPLLPTLIPGFDAGHVVVLVFGLHTYFFQFTTYPYTEGLTYAIVMAALWRFAKLWPNPSWRSGLEMGVWAGLALLARYQLVLLSMAAVVVFGWAIALIPRYRKRYAIMALFAALGSIVVIAPHYLWVSSHVDDLSFSSYLQWQQVRYSDALPPLPFLRGFESLSGFVSDRLEGFPIAFEFGGRFSYYIRYHTFQYSVIVATPVVLWFVLRRLSRSGVRASYDWLRRPENVNWVFVVVFALAGFLSIHALHTYGVVSPRWYFDARHGLTSGFLFALCLVLLLSRRRFPWPVVGLTILMSSAYLGGTSIRAMAVEVDGAVDKRGTPEVVRWLEKQRDKKGGLKVAYRQPQRIAFMTDGIGYHWYYPRVRLNDVLAMVNELGVDYVVVSSRAKYRFLRAKKFKSSFRVAQEWPGLKVYEPVKPKKRKGSEKRKIPERAGS